MDYTEIIIDNIYSVDLSNKDISIPVTYELIDIKNLNRRSGSKTKTITIPRTQKNDKIFGLAFSINGKNQFDKYLPREIRIQKNSQVIFNGLCKLTDVTIDSISFYAFSELSKLKELFGESTLNDLNLDDLDHIYDETIFDTWNGAYPVGVPADYFYPLIDYGQFQDVNPNNSSENPPIKITEVYPALYLKRAIEQIAYDNGYTLKTNFFDDPQIAKILLPFVNEQFIHSDTYLTREFGLVVNRKSEYTVPLTLGAYKIPMENIIYDNLSQYASNEYTAIGGQRMNIFANVRIKTPGTYPVGWQFYVAVERYDVGLSAWLELDSKICTNTINPDYIFEVNLNIPASINSGDKLRFIIYRYSNATTESIVVTRADWSIRPNYVGDNVQNILVGEMVQVAPNLPPIKQIDLFRWCYQMFNWVIFVDDNKGEIQIYTYDEYFKNDNQKNFSNKITLNPAPVINYQPTNFSRKYDFKYKHDQDDYWLTRYDAKINQPYKFGDGQYYLTKEGEATLIGEVRFSPTIIEKSFKGHANDYIYIPTMLDNAEPNIKNTQKEPRILINGGLVSVDKLSDGGLSHVHVENFGLTSFLPLCYFQKQLYYEEDIDSFTLNLSFSTPNISMYTKENLIENFYKNTIDSLSVSAQVTAYFKLNAKDIAELDFSQNWYISYFNAIFRLNKIVDYNVNSLGLTKVELINVGVVDTSAENYQEIKPVNNIVYLDTEILEDIITESTDDIII